MSLHEEIKLGLMQDSDLQFFGMQAAYTVRNQTKWLIYWRARVCMGVATANSVLVISFARERLEEWGDPLAAALDAGFVRFRPVLMTALAMIIGMIPMALGLGEGGEQNAPLGRAVIGGLCFATVATLVLVPLIFSLVHTQRGQSRPTPSSFGVKHA